MVSLMVIDFSREQEEKRIEKAKRKEMGQICASALITS